MQKTENVTILLPDKRNFSGADLTVLATILELWRARER